MSKQNGGIIGPDNVTTGGFNGVASGVFKLGEVTKLIRESKWPEINPFTNTVPNSARFNIASSDKLARTSDSGNTKTFTMSFWVKRSTFGADQVLTNITSGSGKQGRVYFEGSTEQLEFHDVSSGGSYEIRYITTRLFRDTGAWYNIVIAVNTDDGTAGDRVKIYVNGVRETSFATATQPSSGLATAFNSGGVMQIGSQQVPADFFGGYMAEVINVDGTQLAPTSFAEFDEDSNIWKPIDVSGLTFGTNGFYLEYKASGTGTNASGMGADTSGNTNHFAVTNLTATDQSTDTCTNNFATANPLANLVGSPTYSKGNLEVTGNSSANHNWQSTIGVSSGKWYWEMKSLASSPDTALVFYDQSIAPVNTMGAGFTTLQRQKTTNNSSSGSAIGSTAQNDIHGMALDLDNGKMFIHRNGTYLLSGDPANGTNPFIVTADGLATEGVFGGYTYDGTVQLNFGNPAFAISSGNADGDGFGNFEYAPPSGFFALCTKNLAEYG